MKVRLHLNKHEMNARELVKGTRSPAARKKRKSAPANSNAARPEALVDIRPDSNI